MSEPHNPASSYERLRAALIERAHHWEEQAADAEFAGNSYVGVDNDAERDLFREAGRARARAAELRSIVEWADRG